MPTGIPNDGREGRCRPAPVARDGTGAHLRHWCLSLRQRRLWREFIQALHLASSSSTRRFSPAIQAARALDLAVRAAGEQNSGAVGYAPGAGASATAASLVNSRKVKLSCK